MRSKDGVPWIMCVLLYKLMHMFYSVSSHYLLVFGDDHVRGTRGAVDVAVGSGEAWSRSGASWERTFSEFYIL